jgi:hypothetical protein
MRDLFSKKREEIGLAPKLTPSLTEVSREEMECAVKKLSNNKAPGVDNLKDTALKLLLKHEDVMEKTRNTFNKWY